MPFEAGANPKRGKKKDRFTQEQMIAALKQARGMKAIAARSLGCDWQLVNSYCKKYPAVGKVCEEERQSMVDAAELQLTAAVNRGELPAITFVLRHLGRDRGYVERQEVTGPAGGPIQHAHIHLWEERLQAVHTEMAQRKQALLLERNADGTFAQPEETA